MAAGNMCAVEGIGGVRFSVSTNLAFLTSPLLTAGVPLAPVKINLNAGSDVSLSATCTTTGEHQIRITKISADRIRLGLYRKKAAALDIGVTFSAGVSASLKQVYFIEILFDAVSTDPAADIQKLKRAGLSPDQISSIQRAIQAGVKKRLEVALRAEFGASTMTSAVFLYEINLAPLTAASGPLSGHYKAISLR